VACLRSLDSDSHEEGEQKLCVFLSTHSGLSSSAEERLVGSNRYVCGHLNFAITRTSREVMSVYID
jgi:hypothetical protein